MNDIEYMRLAIELAKLGISTTTPNPRVGCIIVDQHKKIIGKGSHLIAGQPHAEIYALKEAGDKAKGATAYVTLEPCCHVGQTPPCTKSLIKSGISRVVIGSVDPNPSVQGKGINQLLSAGITIEKGVLKRECEELNPGFFKRMKLSLPYITIKMAMSMDGRIATKQLESKWITSEKSRNDVQQLRKNCCAILTSSKTILDDNPHLNVRLANTKRQPVKIIADTHLSTPVGSNIFKSEGEVWIFHKSHDKKRINSLCNYAKLFFIDSDTPHIDLKKMLEQLAKLKVNEVLVESGGIFAGALVEKGLVDSLVIYQAPVLLGHEGIASFTLNNINNLYDAYGFQIREYSRIDNNVRVTMTTIV